MGEKTINPIQNSINQSSNPFELERRVKINIMEILAQEEEKHFERILRTQVKPVIKGEITKGKLRWRGISIVHSRIGFQTIRQLAQRGVPVGSAFLIPLTSSL